MRGAYKALQAELDAAPVNQFALQGLQCPRIRAHESGLEQLQQRPEMETLFQTFQPGVEQRGGGTGGQCPADGIVQRHAGTLQQCAQPPCQPPVLREHDHVALAVEQCLSRRQFHTARFVLRASGFDDSQIGRSHGHWRRCVIGGVEQLPPCAFFSRLNQRIGLEPCAEFLQRSAVAALQPPLQP